MLKKLNIKNFAEKNTINRSKVYIIPSKNGLKYIAINFFLFLISISYANNLALLITFIMGTFLILQMFSTHRIINMLTFDHIKLVNQFVDQDYTCFIKTKKEVSPELCPTLDLTLLDKSGHNIPGSYLKIIQNNKLNFKLNFKRRNKYEFKSLKFSTYGPTKLFYVWRYYPIDQEVFIYPKRKHVKKTKLTQSSGKENIIQESEFSHHIRYTQGLNPKRIDWKVYARKDQLYWKKFVDVDTNVYEVNYNQLTGQKEEKLSQMSYLIDRYFHDGKHYKVVLPNKIIDPNSGIIHFAKSMESISAY